jgi:hypothetical protein
VRVIGVLAPAAGDQTAPSVPTGLAGVAVSGSQIDLTWNASTDTGGSGLAGYTVYRDGIQIDTVATESYSDEGLAQDTEYDYQVSAFDASGNHSAVSAIVSVTTTGNSAPEWNTVAGVPSPGATPVSENPLTENQAYFRDLDDLCSDVDSDPITYSESAEQVAPPSGYTQGLPPGVTFNTSLGTLSGTPTTAGNYAYTITADDGQSETNDMEADWLARSTEPGVFYANNFEGCTDTASMLATAYSNGVQLAKKTFDTTNKLSGPGSFRCNHLVSHGANEAAPDFRLSFDGKSAHTKSTEKRRFYFQCASYSHHVWNNFDYGGPGTPKMLIIFEPDQSFAKSEIVEQRSAIGRPMVVGYRLISPGPQTYGLRRTYTGLTASTYHSFQLNPDYSGPTPPTTNSQLRQQRGYTQDSLASDPDFSWDQTRYPDDAWCVREWFIDMDAQIIKFWFARYGEAPQLAMGTIGGAGFDSGSRDFTGIQLLPRPENAVNWPSEDTHINYAEIICSDDPIDFPGGHVLPYPGSDAPPGYPPPNSADVP